MYRFEANFQSVSTDFSYETGVSTPGGLCHKADKFSVGFRAIAFEINGRSGFWLMCDRVFCGWAIAFLGGWAIGFLVDGRSGFCVDGRSNLICESVS
ncbi:MAG: hypothetical protein ACM65K_19145 [Microcoleus sp.]